MANFLHQHDLPDDIDLGPVFAIDTETMGLNLTRDRLCVVQVSSGNGDAHVIQMPQRAQPGVSPFAGSGIQLAPNLSKQLADPSRLKLMHFARFDIASVYAYLGVLMTNVYCTKLASVGGATATTRSPHSLCSMVPPWSMPFTDHTARPLSFPSTHFPRRQRPPPPLP